MSNSHSNIMFLMRLHRRIIISFYHLELLGHQRKGAHVLLCGNPFLRSQAGVDVALRQRRTPLVLVGRVQRNPLDHHLCVADEEEVRGGAGDFPPGRRVVLYERDEVNVNCFSILIGRQHLSLVCRSLTALLVPSCRVPKYTV